MPRYITLSPGILLDVTWRCAECNESEHNVNADKANPAICEVCADPWEDDDDV